MASRNLSVLTRQFSTSSSKHAIVKTPIPVYGIEGRYSAALYSAANKKKALDAVEADLKKLQGAMKSDARFNQFLLDPTIKTNLKIDGLTGASKKLGFNDLTKNLLLALAENNRYVEHNKRKSRKIFKMIKSYTNNDQNNISEPVILMLLSSPMVL